MNFIESILQQKSINTEQSILMGQWEFDKKSIPEALKAISGVFPHYSLHDESHSITILNNIVKMVGEEVIRRLTCSDLWMLLECAYGHDLGMIITSLRIERALEGDEFIKYFMRISADMNHPCYEYTTHFYLKEGKLYQKDEQFKVNIFDSIRFLLSDFFRSKHAGQSKKVLEDPYEEIGLKSPRSVIPQRLFYVIGEICKAHGQDFSFVMGLPKEEDGIGREECHPRFIACLLRLGDLLDIDNNRFSEALLKTIKQMPADSMLHYEKHKAISHVNINRRCIEIEANCNSPKVAQVTQDWFDWISDEFKAQTLKWNRIVPLGLRCYLPTLERLQTNIRGYESVVGSKKNKFTIETAKALELLQGKDLYKNPFDAIRELLQNAVDSTLIRIYLEATNNGIVFDGINQEFLNFAKKYEITISLVEKKNGDYEVIITDKGVGLKKDQLTYLVNTGSSSKDIEKRLLIEKMPEWMRPSGIFGIGFQSIFLITDKVELWGKDFFEDARMSIEMYSPNGPMRGDIYLKKVKENFPVGLSLKFTINKNVKNKSSRDIFNAIPTGMELTMVESKIREYACSSVVPITIIRSTDKAGDKLNRLNYVFFDKKTNVELGFEESSFGFEKQSGLSVYYRNAKISGGVSGMMFLSPRVNIHAGNAKDFLVLNRDSFKDSKKVLELIKESIVDFINSEKFREFLELNKKNQNIGYMFSFFVTYFDMTDRIENKDILTDVMSFKVNANGNEKSFKEIVNTKRIQFSSVSESLLSLSGVPDDEIIIETNLIPIGIPNRINEIMQLLFKFAVKNHKRCYCKDKTQKLFFAGAIYIITNDENDNDIQLRMNDIINLLKGQSFRTYVNYIPGYEELKISAHEINPDIMGSFIGSTFDSYNLIEKIVNPFLRINDKTYDCRNDELYKYVSSQSGKSVEEVKEAYERFVDEAKSSGLVVEGGL